MSYLKLGSHSTEVGILQQILNNINPPLSLSPFIMTGASLVVDNRFGPITKIWVEEFQKTRYLKVDGIVGPNTATALNSISPASIDLTPTANTTPTGIVLYLHGVGVPGYMHIFTKHLGLAPKPLQYDFNLANINTITSDLSKNNYDIKEIVINTHGIGAGLLNIKGVNSQAAAIRISSNTFLSFFKKLKPYIRKNGFISIHACLVANEYKFKSSWAARLANDLDLGNKKYGHGTLAMLQLARTAGVPVKAGFEIQTGASGKFVGPWVEVDPSRGIIVHEVSWVPTLDKLNSTFFVQEILKFELSKIIK